MVKNLIADMMAVRNLVRGANNLQRGVDTAVRGWFDNVTASKGLDSAPPPNVYQNQVVFQGNMMSLMSLFDIFAYKKLSRWRNSNSRTLPSNAGGRVLLQYEANRRYHVRLNPITGWARGQENLRASERRNYDRCIENISYEYVCDFAFEGQGNQVLVAYNTTETINGDGGARRDLLKHYRAPALPKAFGDIGELFIAGLVARGLV
jgi:hypothetical protein